MQHYYSNYKTQTNRQNRIIDVMAEVRPKLTLLNKLFSENNYQGVIDIYEGLEEKYNSFETDLSKIAYSYFQLNQFNKASKFFDRNIIKGNVKEDDLLLLAKIHIAMDDSEKVKNICDELKYRFSNLDAALILADLYKKSGEELNQYFANINVIRVNDNNNKLVNFKAYTNLAKLSIFRDKEEAEYYVFSALHFLNTEFLETKEFLDMTKLLIDNRSLISHRVSTYFGSFNSVSKGQFQKLYRNEFEILVEQIEISNAIFDFAEDILNRSKDSFESIKTEIASGGDIILRNLFEHLKLEQPSFAIAHS
jgi:hypothetical protein